ncbi:GTP-binding A, partial [Paramuricea clavata]
PRRKVLHSEPSIDVNFGSTAHSTSPQKGSVTAKMKPLPRDKKALFQEASSLGLLGASPDLQEPRAKLIDFINSSRTIRRSINHVLILLFGESGVGKSATINHLFGTKDEIAKTSESQSETRSTQEFIIYSSEPRYEVKRLPLGVVDTPGLSDTDGSYQDGCNLLSIKQFFETHPKLSGYFPNLIFLIVKSTDNRIMGKNSELAKSLRCIKELNLVDPKNPNVVAILSHACGVPYKKVEKWSEKMETKKSAVKRIIFEALKVTAPVVLLENMYGEDDNDLDVSGDYTRLPNGVLQPKNLYDACAGVLKKNKDYLALITLNSVFAASTKLPPPELGQKNEAKNAESCTLNAKERAFVDSLEKTARG